MGNIRIELKESLITTFKKMVRMSDHNLAQFGLCGPEYGILNQLGEEEELTLSELSDRTMRVNSHITALVDKMEVKGLVHRNRDEQDRRVIRVGLTETGKQLKAKVIPNHHDFVAQRLSPMKDEDIQSLIKLLKDLELLCDRVL